MSRNVIASNLTNHVRRRLLITGGSALMTSGLPRIASAEEDWPSRPIRIIAAQAPGSSNDTTARALANYLTAQLKTPVMVENKPGAIGMVAADSVARSKPDGYTFLFTLHSQLAQAPVLLKKPPIDPSKDLVPIGSYSTGLSPVCVKKDLPVNNFKELIELSKKRPISAGNYSIGSGWQIRVVQIAKQTGGEFILVNYKGTGPMVSDLMAGTIDIGAGSLIGMLPAIQRGARPVAMLTGDSKNPLLPGIPSLPEAGFRGPAFETLEECNMLLGPSGTPTKIIDRLGNLILRSVTESDAVKAAMAQLGVTETPHVGQDLKEFIARVWSAYQILTRELHINME